MRYQRSVTWSAEDSDVALSLIPPLRDEWRLLQFDDSGPLRNLETGELVTSFRLITGRHRDVGATYTVADDVPLGAPQPGLTIIELVADNRQRLAVRLRDHLARWNASMSASSGPTPTVDGSFHVDMAAAAFDEMGIGCVALLFRGDGKGEGRLQLDALTGIGGELFRFRARVSRFRIRISVDVTGAGGELVADVDVRISGRGIGRLVMLLASKHVTRFLDEVVENLSGQGVDEGSPASFGQVKSEIAEAGGPAAFVHREMWTPTVG